MIFGKPASTPGQIRGRLSPDHALMTVFGRAWLPVAIALGVYGAARATYSNLLGKGHDVVFPANTLIQVQLSPVASAQSQ